MDTSACVFVSLVVPSWYNVRHFDDGDGNVADVDDGGGVDDTDDVADDVFANNDEDELT